VFNKSQQPGNFGIENVSARINGIDMVLPDHDALAAAAERRARQQRIGTALIAGALAGVASTASNDYSYRRYVHTPHGTYVRTIARLYARQARRRDPADDHGRSGPQLWWRGGGAAAQDQALPAGNSAAGKLERRGLSIRLPLEPGRPVCAVAVSRDRPGNRHSRPDSAAGSVAGATITARCRQPADNRASRQSLTARRYPSGALDRRRSP